MLARFNWRRYGLVAVTLPVVTVIFIAAAFAPLIEPYDPYALDVLVMLNAPSVAHPMGTDELGRDVLSRVIHASQISITVGLVAVLIGAVGGTIIGILAAVIVPRFTNRSRNARISAAEADINANLATALELYELDNGQFPTTQQGLQALVQEPTIPPLARRWQGPYIRGGLPADPWGSPYQYAHPSQHGLMDYDLWSYGPDGLDGGGDATVIIRLPFGSKNTARKGS